MTEKLLTGTSNKKNKPNDSERAGVEEKCWNQKNLKTLLGRFYTPPLLKSAGCYVIPSVQKFAFERPSVRPSVLLSDCPSGRPAALRFHSLPGSIFNQFSSNLV